MYGRNTCMPTHRRWRARTVGERAMHHTQCVELVIWRAHCIKMT
jgi:hypothetical protein